MRPRRFTPLRLCVLALACAPAAAAQTADEPPDPFIRRGQIACDLAPKASVETLIEMLGDDRPEIAQVARDQFFIRNINNSEALHTALHSPNRRRSQLAAHVLVDEDTPHEPPEPDEALLNVLIEALRDDDLPRTAGPNFGFSVLQYSNAGSAARYLINHIDKAEPLLVGAMSSHDPQQSFLAAFCLAHAGRTEHVAAIAQILLPHLRDNQFECDAQIAANGLYHLGVSALPSLRSAMLSADDQARRYLQFLIAAAELADRSPVAKPANPNGLPMLRAALAPPSKLHPLTEDEITPVIMDTLEPAALPLGLMRRTPRTNIFKDDPGSR